MHNNLIEDRPETYYVIEPTPLKVYCPQLEGSVHPPRLKGPWEENVEPFGTYHPIHVCNQHEPTAVLQKEADIPIRPANNETEARELNKALQSAMLQQQRLTTGRAKEGPHDWLVAANRRGLQGPLVEPVVQNETLRTKP